MAFGDSFFFSQFYFSGLFFIGLRLDEHLESDLVLYGEFKFVILFFYLAKQ